MVKIPIKGEHSKANHMGREEIQLCIKSVMKYEYRIGNNSISGNKSTLRSSTTYLYGFEYLLI